jgi:polyhydroxyalkanoate synthesis regulator phasin
VTQLDGLRRYLEAATTLTQITRGRAEELVRELVASGEVERSRAQDWIKRSREASETLVNQVSSEVEKQLGERLKDLDLDDLARRVAGMIELAGTLGRNATSQARDRVVPGRSPKAPVPDGRPSKAAKRPRPSSNGKAETKAKGDSKKATTKDSKESKESKKPSASKRDPGSKKEPGSKKKESSKKSADPGGTSS